ncbi:gp83 [Alphaproteobacteria phage PhiJL001]|uniref:Gp83 n=1 Tax=Alphaproteobacteria phage PhiJL001 TaxID=2681607 RepID=Q5DN22_9CAUD|nr:glycoside hydrolase [Alphaproteobacteria phage PhiJL001]AAT69467.1 gp83 [Alphaproteobacteria phage PhiJL001]
MAFDETRLPDDVERGAQGGPRFKTTVITLSSGFERRNSDWAQTRGEWDVGYGIQDATDLEDVIAFFYARNGRARGFRFKDWTDYVLSRQAIGTTDGSNATFQLFKRYTSGSTSFDRILSKIVTATTQVWVNNVEAPEGGASTSFAIDTTTGIITLGSSLAAQSGTTVEAACQFDVPVRFGSDALDITAEWADAVGAPNIPIVEIRV